jgi:hypothetical protein
MVIASFNVQSFFSTYRIYIYTWRSFFCFSLSVPLAPLCTPFTLTWHPPAVTGIVLLRLRLLVNWPCLPLPSPNCPALFQLPNPNCPAPNNDDLGTNLLLLCGTLATSKLPGFFFLQFPRFLRPYVRLDIQSTFFEHTVLLLSSIPAWGIDGCTVSRS